MAATITDGPDFVYGNLANIEANVLSPEAVPDPNADAGPSMFFQGDGVLDPRIIFLKDKIIGFTGVVQGFLAMDILESTRSIPATAGAANIAAAQTVASGVPMTLAAANSFPGIAINIPIRAFSPVLNAGAVSTAAVALDYGFGWATAVAGSATFTVGNVLDYFVGMSLCIAGAGNVGGTTSLLTFITSINLSGGTITCNNTSAYSGTVGIGTGDLWGPSEAVPSTGGYPTPLAAYPFLGAGPSLLMDSRQTTSRGLRIVGVTGGTGGNFLISGADIYGQPMTQLLTVGAGAVTGWTLKMFKYIFSVVPQFTDGTHNYSVGTADQFGFGFRSTLYEDMTIFQAANWDASNAGWLGAITTNPATNLTGDVRGSISIGTTNSAGAGFTNSAASNGTLSALLPTGNRLEISQQISVAQAIQATQLTPYYLLGVTQA
jgi:hypothetical protein